MTKREIVEALREAGVQLSETERDVELWVPWERVERLLTVGNLLADASRDVGLTDEWDAARYKIIPQRPS